MRSREVHEGFDGPTLGSGAMAAARMRSQSSSPRWPDEGLRTTGSHEGYGGKFGGTTDARNM